MDFKQFSRNLQQSPLQSVYFFYGDESYFIDELCKIVYQRTVEPGTADFNYDRFYGDEAEAEYIVKAATAFPMMAEKKLVRVDNVQKLSVSAKNALASYLNAPAEHTCLVLTAGKVDMRKSFYQQCRKKAVSFESKPLYPREVPGWVKAYFKKQQLTISDQAAELLLEQAGTSITSLISESEKVITACQGKHVIEKDDIAEVVGFSRDCTVYEFLDAVAEKNSTKALYIMQKLLESGISAVYLISLLYQRFETLLRIKSVDRQRKSLQELAGACKVAPYFFNKSCSQAEKFQKDELTANFHRLLKADLYLKTGQMTSDLLMTSLVHEIIKAVPCVSARSLFA